MSEPRKCLTCKDGGDLSEEEIPYWSKKKGNYSPYPKMITCDAKYALEDREMMVEETPPIEDTEITLELKLGDSVENKWVFYFAANPSKNPLEILSPDKAYGNDENHGLVKTNDGGKAILKFNCPQPYKVDGVTYSRHVHYLIEEDGIWSKMKTKRVICDISLEELDKVIKEKNALIINALNFKEFDKEKIPGSINISCKKLKNLTKEKKETIILDELKQGIQSLKVISDKVNSKKLDIKDVPIITYCANPKCDASEKLINHLYECGINNVLEFSLGIEGWLRERSFFKNDDSEEEDESEEDSEEEDDSEDESEEDSDDDDSSEEMIKDSSEEEDDETIEITHEGVDYIYDKANKELCDDNADVVATADLENGKLKNIKWKKGEKELHKKKSSAEEIDEEEESEAVDDEEEAREAVDDEDEASEAVDDKDEASEAVDDEEEASEAVDDEEEEKFHYEDEKLRVKTKNELKEIVINMTKRKGGTYKFPLETKKFRRKVDLIGLIQKCQGKSKSSNDKFQYLDEDELYSFKISELKDHINNMILRDKDSYQFSLRNFDKEGLIDLILSCQGEPISQSGGCGNDSKIKGRGWGFMF